MRKGVTPPSQFPVTNVYIPSSTWPGHRCPNVNTLNRRYSKCSSTPAQQTGSRRAREAHTPLPEDWSVSLCPHHQLRATGVTTPQQFVRGHTATNRGQGNVAGKDAWHRAPQDSSPGAPHQQGRQGNSQGFMAQGQPRLWELQSSSVLGKHRHF